MSTIIYSRFSPRKNAGESESCETQESLCLQYAEDKGLTPIAGMFRDEGVSGKVVDRPGLDSAIDALKRGDVLLVYRRDRIARDVLIAELTRRRVAKKGATIVAVDGDVKGEDDDPTVIFVRQILDAVAELERKQIATRTRDAMRARQRAGQRMGRYAPYGYRVDPDDPTKLQPIQNEQTAIARVKELAHDGLSVYAILKVMDSEHPAASRGKRWHHKTIKRILRRA